MFRKRYQALSTPERRAFWIAFAMTVIFAVFASTVIETLLVASNLQYVFANTFPLILTITSLISAILIFTGRVTAGSILIQAGTFFCLLLAVTQAEGFGILAAFILLAVTIYIPAQTLKGRSSATSFWGGVIGSLSLIVIDTYWIGQRVPAPPEDVMFATILSCALALLIVTTTILQFNKYTIRNKLLILAMGTGLVSILSVAVLTTYSTQQALLDEVHAVLVSSAEHTMSAIDSYISSNIDTMSTEAQLPDLVNYLKSTPTEQANAQSEILILLNILAERDPENIGSYALLNADGIDVADTYTQDIGINKSDRDYYLEPRRTGRAFVSPVRYSPTSTDHGFYIGIPVTDENGLFLGVLRVRYRSSILTQIVKSNNEFAGTDSYGILLDEYNIVLAHGTDPDWVAHTLVKPDIDTFTLLQRENRIQGFNLNEISLEMPDFNQKLQTYTASEPYFSGLDDGWGEPVEIGVSESSKSAFLKLSYTQPQSIALQPITRQTKVTVAIALITGVLIMLAGYFVSRTITKPIVNLASIAEEIAAGDLTTRANYTIDDELGTLANSFNRMTIQLQDTLGGLERRVAERTADLNTARLLSEHHAQELQSISVISRTISTEQRLEVLLPLITRLVSERFDFYHVGIFFLDATHRFAYLQAANSEGGQKMLVRGHRLEVGTGLVGTVAKTGKARIALDVGTDAAFFDNPDLPNTRSEMALPLTVRGQAIGVLDVQSVKAGAFTESDANTLSILADQVAIAIENARLFGQAQQARDEAETLYTQVLRQEWSAFSKREAKIGYRQTATGGKSLSKLVETEEIQQALENGQVVIVDNKDGRSQPTVAVPVKLRGETIGVLNIKASTKDRNWNQDEINLAQAISDRLALALDNVRLLQESQRRAAKEAKIGEVSAKIGASINLRNVLQTAVEELGRALPGSEVVIQFEKPGDQR